MQAPLSTTEAAVFLHFIAIMRFLPK